MKSFTAAQQILRSKQSVSSGIALLSSGHGKIRHGGYHRNCGMPTRSRPPCQINLGRCYSTQDTKFSESVIDFFYYSWPVETCENVLTSIHDVSGLPWWATIFLTTLSLRTLVTFPLAAYSSRVLAKAELLQPEIKTGIDAFETRLKSAILSREIGEKEARVLYARTMKDVARRLWVRDNCHPLKASVLGVIQMPLWVCMSLSTRKLCGCIPGVPALPAMAAEGALWFPDLGVPDPLVVLPLVLVLSHLATIEIHGLLEDPNVRMSRFQKAIKNFFRLLSVWIAFLGVIMPSGVSLYWSTSAACGLAQNVALRFPRVRRLCSIPRAPSELDRPVSTAVARLKHILRITKS